MRALGVDGAGRFGWVGVVVDDDGFCSAHVGTDLAALIADAEVALPEGSVSPPGPAGSAGTAKAQAAVVAPAGGIEVVGVDIPVGLVDGPRRSADVAARRYVGPTRRASVFPAPPRCVLDVHDYQTANGQLEQRRLPKLSKQAFFLLPGIRQAAAVAAARMVVEVFPEATIRLLAGADLAWSKKTWAGSAQRRELLASADPPVVVPSDVGPAGAAPVDDVLDAAAAAWSALRVAHGTALALGDPDEIDPRTGRRIAVWV